MVRYGRQAEFSRHENSIKAKSREAINVKVLLSYTRSRLSSEPLIL